MQLKISNPRDIVFKWIPFNQFNDIIEKGKNNFSVKHSAIWKDGPLNYDSDKLEYMRVSDKNVALKCLSNSSNSQNIIDKLLSEV